MKKKTSCKNDRVDCRAICPNEPKESAIKTANSHFWLIYFDKLWYVAMCMHFVPLFVYFSLWLHYLKVNRRNTRKISLSLAASAAAAALNVFAATVQLKITAHICDTLVYGAEYPATYTMFPCTSDTDRCVRMCLCAFACIRAYMQPNSVW